MKNKMFRKIIIILLFQQDHIQLVPLTHLSMDWSAHLLGKDIEYNKIKRKYKINKY